MNTDKSLHRFRLCLCVLVLALAGCTGQELPDVPSPSIEPAGLRFTVTPMGATTRVSYDGVGSMFEDNDTIGCVITIDGQYAANSAWHYCASTGMLIFDYYWGNVTIQHEYWSETKWGHISYNNETDNKLISRRSTDIESGTDGFITLKQSGMYNFYFYYPYIASNLLVNDVKTTFNNYNQENELTFFRELTYPNAANNEDLTYTDNNNTSQTLTENTFNNYISIFYLTGDAYDGTTSSAQFKYTWTAYPCFVNHTQTSKAQINNSDFLWVSREGITSASSQRVNLVFEKKTATIEIDSDIALTDVYLQSQGELRRGKQINLQTGELTDYAYSTEYNASMQQKNIYFTNTEELLPYDNSNGNKTNYRLVLPAQDAFPCTLHFTLDNVAREIDLSTNISQLEEGTLYIIHINRAGETTFEIVDWEYGDFELVDPDNDFE